MLKVMDHSRYQRELKTKSVESLRFIIKDAREAIKANPTNQNNGYYADEVHYAHAELQRRDRLAESDLAMKKPAKQDPFFEFMFEPNERLGC